MSIAMAGEWWELAERIDATNQAREPVVLAGDFWRVAWEMPRKGPSNSIHLYVFQAMKPSMSNQKTARPLGFTFLEMIVVLVVLAVLAGMLLPTMTHRKQRSRQISCSNNLKQIGLAFQVFANDHDGRFPMQVWPDAQAGEPSSEAVFIFRSMSNELSTPKVLWCPTDNRGPATNFTLLPPSNISYFVGLNAVENYPQSILAGDRNLTTNGVPVAGLLPVTTNTVLGWSRAMHDRSGNLALGDGSVQPTTESRLQDFVRGQGAGTNWLAIP
jgi:prepilin-type N-terminal cleavage/methylation domain-containing protein